jgi:hypothetical protein
MPVRFTSPSLGGQRESFFRAGEWQIGLAYRHLGADQWFVGTEVQEQFAPSGRPLYLDIHSLDISVAYGLTDRASLALTLPFSYGTHSRFYGDDTRHEVSAFGLGDISLVGTAWLFPPSTHPGGNLAFGMGVKSPSGNNEVLDDFWLADGSVARRPVDQSIQLGDGGWGFLLQIQGFRRVADRANGYLFGSYLLSPREKTDVVSPYTGVVLSVPDVYTARAGMAYALLPAGGLSVSLGTRLDGIPLRDIIGRGDLGFRRPGYILYADPGLAIRRGRSELTINLPIRLRQDFRESLVDRELDRRGGGDLADVLVFVGLTYRLGRAAPAPAPAPVPLKADAEPIAVALQHHRLGLDVHDLEVDIEPRARGKGGDVAEEGFVGGPLVVGSERLRLQAPSQREPGGTGAHVVQDGVNCPL